MVGRAARLHAVRPHRSRRAARGDRRLLRSAVPRRDDRLPVRGQGSPAADREGVRADRAVPRRRHPLHRAADARGARALADPRRPLRAPARDPAPDDRGARRRRRGRGELAGSHAGAAGADHAGPRLGVQGLRGGEPGAGGAGGRRGAGADHRAGEEALNRGAAVGVAVAVIAAAAGGYWWLRRKPVRTATASGSATATATATGSGSVSGSETEPGSETETDSGGGPRGYRVLDADRRLALARRIEAARAKGAADPAAAAEPDDPPPLPGHLVPDRILDGIM